jgi:hypothetical protein
MLHLLIDKALYELHSSSECWRHRFPDVLRDLRLCPACKVEKNVWMRETIGWHAYIAVCVNDFLIAANYHESVKKAL